MTTHDATPNDATPMGEGSAPSPAEAAPPARRRRGSPARRALARRQQWIAAAFVLAPGALSLLFDVVRRARRIFAFDRSHTIGYTLSWGIAIAMWATLVLAASRRRGRLRQVAAGVFGVMFAFSAGTQQAFFSRFNVYASRDTAVYSDSFPLTLVASFPQGTAGTLAIVAGAAVLAITALAAARSFVRPRRRPARRATIAAASLIAFIFLMLPVSYRASIQSSPPELIYLNSLAHHVGARIRDSLHPESPELVRVQRRFPQEVPALSAAPAAPRNVLFLLQESLRADVTCTEPDAKCPLPAQHTNPLLPHRFPFMKMRSAASSTAVAISNLWSGVDPTSSFERLHSAPLLWEYAHAAGYDTAYWTSQSLVFGNARLYVQDLPVSHFVSGTNLDPRCDVLAGAKDALLTDHVIKHWSELKEPFFAVVHYSNLHQPRVVDVNDEPYQPSGSKNTSRFEDGRNYYRNAVWLTDMATAKLVQFVRGTESGGRTVIVFTSDHGESFGEHKNENDHSATVFDEELRVPTWIDGPPGTLSAQESMSLAMKKRAPLLQYDLAATFLDLLGLWDLPAMAPYRERIIGRPLTRPELYEQARPLTNVSWVWEYHLPNWGMILGSRKIVAVGDDPGYQCFDLETDPKETRNLGAGACPELVAAAKERFKILPRDMKDHMRSRPDVFGPWPPPPAP